MDKKTTDKLCDACIDALAELYELETRLKTTIERIEHVANSLHKR